MRPTVGDVYCAYAARLPGYAACQVVALAEEYSRQWAVLLDLDWQGAAPPTAREIRRMKPLLLDWRCAAGAPSARWVPPIVPRWFQKVGNMPPLLRPDGMRLLPAATWEAGGALCARGQWLRIPKARRERYCRAILREESAFFGGRLRLARHPGISDRDFSRLSELRALPWITRLTLERWHQDLPAFLRDNWLIERLELSGHGQRELDFRGANLRELVLRMDGVVKLRLGEGPCRLTMVGHVSPELDISAPEGGRWLEIQCAREAPLLGSVPDLGALRCEEVRAIDVSAIARAYPALTSLALLGLPGRAQDFGACGLLAQLEELRAIDLYGFSGADLPEPESLPNLRFLAMDSLPEDAALRARRLYCPLKRQGLYVDISRPRRPEWFAQNLDNPFRAWAGNAAIRQADAKRAAEAYRRLRAALPELIERGDQEALHRIVADYTALFNEMDRKTPVDTEARELIHGALCALMDLIPICSRLSRDHALAVFERMRTF